MPWVYLRRDLAKQWGVPPWVIDNAPQDEVALELAIRAIEGEVAAWQAAQKKRKG